MSTCPCACADCGGSAAGGNADIVKLLLDNASRLPQDYKTKEGWSSNLLQVGLCSWEPPAGRQLYSMCA